MSTCTCAAAVPACCMLQQPQPTLLAARCTLALQPRPVVPAAPPQPALPGGGGAWCRLAAGAAAAGPPAPHTTAAPAEPLQPRRARGLQQQVRPLQQALPPAALRLLCRVHSRKPAHLAAAPRCCLLCSRWLPQCCLPQVTCLTLAGPASDTTASNLGAQFPGLRTLQLLASDLLSDAGLKKLTRAPCLAGLLLERCRHVTEFGVCALLRAGGLRALAVHGCMGVDARCARPPGGCGTAAGCACRRALRAASVHTLPPS